MAPFRPGIKGLGDVVDRAGTAGGNHRHGHRIGHRPGELKGVAGLGAIAIHRGEQDLAGAQRHHPAGPGDRIEAGVLPATLDIHVPATGGAGPGVDGHDDALAAEALRTAGHQLGITHGGGVEAHLVGTGPQQRGDALNAADPTAHGEGDRDRLGAATHQLHQGGAALVAGGDVEKDQLIGPRCAVATGQFHRVTGIPQTHEVHPLHHPAIGHVETGDDPLGNHGRGLR